MNCDFVFYLAFLTGQRSYQPPSCQCSNQGFAWVPGIRAASSGDNSASIQDSTRVAMDTLKGKLHVMSDNVSVYFNNIKNWLSNIKLEI